jgi:mannose-6-phosphate isomerase-like protein (cupin superfamily)
VMMEWSDDGGSSPERPIDPLHIHHGGEEAWYVLAGTLGVRLADEVYRREPGA